MCVILIPASSEAIHFGSVVKNNDVVAEGGETVKFSILVWTMDEEHDVEFYVKDAPENWNIIIVPDSFTLSEDPEQPIEMMSINNEYIKAKLVFVYVGIPEGEKGKHNVVLNALVGSEENQIKVQQERQFVLKIDTGEYVILEDDIKEDTKQVTSAESNDEPVTTPSPLSYVLIILILISAWLIYKHE